MRKSDDDRRPTPEPLPQPPKETCGEPRASPETLSPARTPPRSITHISMQDIEIGEMIGQGSFAKVYVAALHMNGNMNPEVYALKKIDLDKLNDREDSLIRFQQEVNNMRETSHPSLLHLIHCVTWEKYLIILTPLQPFLSMQDIMRGGHPHGLAEGTIAYAIRDILSAIQYLHSKRYIHRTIKASHILVGFNGHTKLTGFRHMVKLPEGQETVTDPNALADMSKYLNWLAPEMLQQDSSGFGLKSDIYSLGITIVELGNGIVPYSDVSPPGILVRVLNEPPPKLWCKSFLPSQDNKLPRENFEQDLYYREKEYSIETTRFVESCLSTAPDIRASIDELIKMKFITSISKKKCSGLFAQLGSMPRVVQFSRSQVFRTRADTGTASTSNEESAESTTEWDF